MGETSLNILVGWILVAAACTIVTIIHLFMYLANKGDYKGDELASVLVCLYAFFHGLWLIGCLWELGLLRWVILIFVLFIVGKWIYRQVKAKWPPAATGVIILLAMVVAVYAPAAEAAGAFFNTAEQDEIQRVVAKVLPGCRADFGDIESGAGIIVGPPRFNLLYLYVKRDGDLFADKPLTGYKTASEKIWRKVFEIMDRWPAARFLAPGPKELRGER